ncbi:MAG: pyridoxamine 5'-phosphate oxidase family protein, partial [Candidatus Methylomirabilis sp.]|nr:pyridoxamine 5'-phosphate oxidase family protein [Deltaproteobacteria bacterium]
SRRRPTSRRTPGRACWPSSSRRASAREDAKAPVGQDRRADTFFIATAHAEGGADASHRGGMPGFVRVESERDLWMPDYFGNFMFQTLGNLEVDPRAGLLFVDFETGATLQLTGEARVLWDDPRIAATPGAERIVAFRAEEIVETPNAFPFAWAFEGWSPHNPK